MTVGARGARFAILVVCDGLRADLVDEATAPTLSAMRGRHASFPLFRSVFPSTTRTSAASIATGCRPAAHGLLGNTMVLDEGRGLECLSAGKPDFLDRLRRATGRALLRPTLSERVRALGRAVVMSNVSPGAAYVQDPEGAGFVHHRAGSFGIGREALPALAIEVGAAGDAAMTRRFCDDVLGAAPPPWSVLWLSEPDHSGHHHPLGSPEHLLGIAAADRCVGEVAQAVARIDPAGERSLLIVCSDHGMETIRRRIDLDARLVEAGLKASADSTDVVVAPQGTSALVHCSPAAFARRGEIADWLGRQDFIGRVLSGEDLAAAGLPDSGTLALAVTFARDDEPNAFGVRGRSDIAASPFAGESTPGHGQHGGLGPNEQNPFLVIRGGGVPPGTHAAATSLVDLAPTVLAHLGLPLDGTEGRPLAARRIPNPSPASA